MTTVSPGAVVTLTATVMAGSTPVTPGLVEFCDATAMYCGDIHLVGTAQLTSAGTAVLKFRPGVGSHSYKAVFAGTKTYAATASSAMALTVSGPQPTLTVGGYGGKSGSYTMSAQVFGAGTVAPTGTVSFLDTNNGNAVLASAPLVPNTAALDFRNAVMTGSGGESPGSSSIAVGDFNGDGIPDVVTAWSVILPVLGASASYGISVFLGNGDGTFTQAPNLPVTSGFEALTVADINGDGIPDLAALGIGGVEVFLGKGDGTFAAPVSTSTVSSFVSSMAVGDFNDDGIPDLAMVGPYAGNTVTVLLGNGDGTFTAAAASPATGGLPAAIIAADFNGDGILDLAVANSEDNTVTVLQGNGDGTFALASTTPVLPQPSSLAVADFNGDGIPDLAVNGVYNGSSYEATLLMGNGQGAFTASTVTAPSSATANELNSIAVGDFNGDGIADLAATSGNLALVIFFGKGDGTFPTNLVNGTLFGSTLLEPYQVETADFNGDGVDDLAVGNSAYSGINVLIVEPQSPSATVTPVSLSLGTYVVEASYPGNANYGPSVSGPHTIANTIPTTTTLSITPIYPQLGQPVTLTATLSPYSQAGYSTNGESITFSSSGVLLGTAPLSGGVATLTTSLPEGEQNPFAQYAGDNYFGPSGAGVAVTVSPDRTALTLTANPASSALGQPVTLTATLSNYDPQTSVDGETISFDSNGTLLGSGTIASGIATLSVSTLPAGFDQLTASYAGDSNNAPASSNTFLESVAKAGQAVVNLSLAVTSSGSAVTSVALGTPVTLTATATVAGTPVTAGTVAFCDSTGGHSCFGVGRLGTAQLTSNGTASMTLRLGIGAQPLQAILTEPVAAGVTSSNLPPLTVTGKYATTTAFTAGQVAPAGDWQARGTVQGIAPLGSPYPAGSVQFIDQSNSNAVVSTQPVTNLAYEPALFNASAQTPATGSTPFSIAAGDFNHDGFPDLAVANSADSTVGILLGNGDGTFQTQVTYAVGSGAFTVVVADFNNDGNPDLAVTNFSANTISILLGNGDGTFQPQQTYATGGGPDAIAVGDFNNDGNLDLAITNQTDNTVSILLGNGDGTFGSQNTFATGDGPDAVVTADFNNDGNLDLVVANNTANTISTLLGAGDGTFGAQVPYAVAAGPTSLATADFNGDGYADLAVACITANSVTILTGNGAGGWTQPTSPYPVAAGPEAVTAGDFAGQGRADWAVVSSAANSVTIEANNGNGGFLQSTPYATGKGPLDVATADWNGDGLTDLAVLNSTDATVSVLLNGSGTRVSVADFTVVLPGDHRVAAVYSGDSSFNASTSPAQSLNGAAVATAITLTPSVNPSNFGEPVTLTATLTPYSAGDESTDGETVTFLDAGSAVGTAALASGVATLTTAALPVGSNSLEASYPGNSAFKKSVSTAIGETVRPSTLTVTGPALSRAYGAPNPPLTGTVSGAANGDAFTVTGVTTATQTSPPGAYPIVPAASGTDLGNYTVVTVDGNLTVTQAMPTITLTSSANTAFVSNPVVFTATVASSGGAPTGSISFYDGTTLLGNETASSGVAVYSTSALSAGAHSITAVYSGDTNFATATSAALPEAIVSFIIGTPSGETSATASAGGTATYKLTFTPPPGETFPAVVNLTAGGLPAGATATFSPASIAAGAGATNVTLTVSLPSSASAHSLPFGGGALPVALCVVLLPFALGPRKGRRGLGSILCLAALAAGAAAAVAISGCGGSGGGGGSSTAAPQTYTLTVTATSSSLSSDITLTLTVE